MIQGADEFDVLLTGKLACDGLHDMLILMGLLKLVKTYARGNHAHF